MELPKVFAIVRYGGYTDEEGNGNVSCLPETNRIGMLWIIYQLAVTCNRFNECYYLSFNLWKVSIAFN